MKNYLDVRRIKRIPTHPGEMLLEEFLKPLEMSQAAAARKMRISSSRLNALIRKKRRVTAQTALRLAEFLHTSPELWLNLQMGWDLWHAYRAEGRTKKARLERKGWKFGSAATFLGLRRDEENRLPRVRRGLDLRRWQATNEGLPHQYLPERRGWRLHRRHPRPAALLRLR